MVTKIIQPPQIPSKNLPNDSQELVYSEFDFSTETPERIQRLNELWAEGFRVIVPMYWKEINFSFQRTPLILLGSWFVAMIVVGLFLDIHGWDYSHTETWGQGLYSFIIDNIYSLFIAFLIITPIYPAYAYYRMRTSVEAFIKRGGIKPANVNYDRFYICEYNNHIIACVGVKDGEMLEDPPKPKENNTQGSTITGNTTHTDTDTPRIMSVWRLTVDPQFRKFGLGRKMMKLCEDYGIEQGYDFIKLLAGNIDSIRFYERLNYEVDRVAWSSGRHVSLYFRKDLRPSSSKPKHD